MPGMITVILRGPLNPSTLVSCQMVKGNEAISLKEKFWLNSAFVFTHVAYGRYFLSRVALFQQSPGVFAGVCAVVVHCEFGAHKVGSVGINMLQVNTISQNMVLVRYYLLFLFRSLIFYTMLSSSSKHRRWIVELKAEIKAAICNIFQCFFFFFRNWLQNFISNFSITQNGSSISYHCSPQWTGTQVEVWFYLSFPIKLSPSRDRSVASTEIR